jgi:hypothetical protein
LAALLSLALVIANAPTSFASSFGRTALPDTCLGHHEHQDHHAMHSAAAHHGSGGATHQNQQDKEKPHPCCCDGLGCTTVAALLPAATSVLVKSAPRFDRALPVTSYIGVPPDPDPDPPRPITLL